MTTELPADGQALLKRLVRDSMRRALQRNFPGQKIEEALESPNYIRLATHAWWNDYAQQTELLGKLASKALAQVEQNDYGVAVTTFIRGTREISLVGALVHANPYLGELCGLALESEERFREVLTLFVQLADVEL